MICCSCRFVSVLTCFFFFFHTSISHKWPINVWMIFNFQSVNGGVRMRTVCVHLYIFCWNMNVTRNPMQMLAVCVCVYLWVPVWMSACAFECWKVNNRFVFLSHTTIECKLTKCYRTLAHTHTSFAPISIFCWLCLPKPLHSNSHETVVSACVCMQAAAAVFSACVRSTLLVKRFKLHFINVTII